MKKRVCLPLLLEFLLYALLAAFALRLTWLTWPDACVDFSRELYLPWRVSCGDVLYRDLAYYFGPLSVYANAILFALLGHPSVHALFALNFAFWLATLFALRVLLRRLAPPAVATLCISLFILLFSFNRYVGLGNDNFLAPYSHELPRGLLLAFLSLLSLDSAFRRRSSPLHLLSGVLFGLSLFTKPEIALAAVSASSLLFLVHFLWGRGRPARDGKSGVFRTFILPFALGVLIALAAVLLPLSIALGSFSQALHDALLKLCLDCFDPALSSLPYFKNVMGTDDIPSHLLRIVLGTALAAAPFLLAHMALPRISSRPPHLATAALLVLAAAAIGFFAFFPLNAALPLAPVLFAMATLRKNVHVGNTASCRVLPERKRPARDGREEVSPPSETRNPKPEVRPHLPLALAFDVFALALVSKIVLNCGIGHYGFVLALPAFCCAVLLAFHPPCPRARVAVAAALLLGFSAAALRLQAGILRRWDVSHAVHDGTFLTSRFQADAFNAALDWIRANTPPGSTLAVLPEGAILNVLSERPNSTPYVSLEQPAWLRFDESSVLSAYSNAPPDTLVLVQTDPPRFGIDYAQSLMAFLDPLYAPALNLTLTTPSGTVPYLLVATRIPPP